MGKTKKLFLPKWYRYVMVPMMVLIWGLITYMEFFNSSAEEELGMVGYVLLSILFLGLTVMFWLMTSGKLPAYVIKEEDDDSKS